MTELDLLIDFHKKAKRQGPGSLSDTGWGAIGFKINLNDKILSDEFHYGICWKMNDI